MTRTQTIGGTVAVLVAVLLGLALSIDAVARSVLESTLSRAVGTEATVESLDLEVLSGRVTLEGLALANPEGSRAPASCRCDAGGSARAWPTSSGTRSRSGS